VPRSLTVHYPGAPRIGTLRIAVTVERVGRTVATVSARATQDERLIALALAAFSSSFPGADFQTARMPQVPGPEQVEPATMPGAPPFTENFEYRFTHGGRPFEGREEAVTGGWLRLREPRVLDAPLAAAYADAWIPAVFQRLDAMAVAPTIDLTVHFREALPMAGAAPDDFVLGVFRSVRARDGLWEEDGELWSADGRLLVQSRQLAALMTQP
jgi:acyl-CoA thioesterase